MKLDKWQIFGLVMIDLCIADGCLISYLIGAPWWELVIVLEIATYTLFKSTSTIAED